MRPRGGAVRAAQRVSAGLALLGIVSVSGGLAASSLGCWSECAAGCDNAVHLTVRDPMNALKGGPARFNVCGGLCATFEFDGTNCVPVGSVNGMFCSVGANALEFDVFINDVERASVAVDVSAASAAVGDSSLFNASTDVDTTAFEVCGQTCHEADAEFTIPPS